MMADHGIVTWIAIVLLIVCSVHSIAEGDNNSLCYKNVTRRESHHIPYSETYKDCGWFSCSTKIKTRYYITYTKVTVEETTCCEGYENKSLRCEPKCEPNCTNGYCIRPNVCKCNYGWAEDLCNKTLLCIIRLNSTAAESSVPTSSDYIGLERGRPECKPKCSDSSISELMDSGNSTYKFLPIDSPCNIVVPLRHSYNSIYIGMGTLMGIILFLVIVFCVIRVVRKKRKMNNPMDNIYDHHEHEPEPKPKSEPTIRTHLDESIVGPPFIVSYESNPSPQLECDYVDPKTVIKSPSSLPVKSGPKSERTIYTHLSESTVGPPFIFSYDSNPVSQPEYDYMDPKTIIASSSSFSVESRSKPGPEHNTVLRNVNPEPLYANSCAY